MSMAVLGLSAVRRRNLVEMLTVVEYIREDHCVPGREARLQCVPSAVFRCLAGEITNDGRREIQERLGDLKIGIRRSSVHLDLSALY